MQTWGWFVGAALAAALSGIALVLGLRWFLMDRYNQTSRKTAIRRDPDQGDRD